MGRSYLFGGDTRHLTPTQYQLELMYDNLDREGHRITPDQFFKSPEYAQFLSGKYGNLADQVPPGSQILNQTPFKLEYKDADGYTHTIIRAGADAAEAGQISRQTDRPPIVPNAAQQGQQSFLQELQGRLQQGFGQPATLAQLDPETAAALQAITQARNAAINKQIEDERGKLIAGFYGNNVNKSSIANEAGARFAEGAGRLLQQEGSDAANRELAIRNLLTSLGQQNRELQTGLYGQLTGQGLQRDIAGAGLGLDAQKLEETIRQFNRQYGLQDRGLTIEQQKVDAANSGFNKFIQTLNAVAGIAQGAGTAYGAYAGGGRGSVPAPTPPTYFPSSNPNYSNPANYPWPTPRYR